MKLFKIRIDSVNVKTSNGLEYTEEFDVDQMIEEFKKKIEDFSDDFVKPYSMKFCIEGGSLFIYGCT
jgi:hypothetical protein